MSTFFNELYDQAIEQFKIAGEEKIAAIQEALNKNFDNSEWDMYLIEDILNDKKKNLLNNIPHYLKPEESNKQKLAEFITTQISSIPFYRIVIHFPETVISNSNGAQHTVRDFYIIIDLKPSFLLYEIKGYRATLTWDEYCSGYGHSHMSNGTYNDINYLCFGSGPLATISSYMRSRWDINNFQMALIQLPRFVSWESIGGMPYNYIERIGGRNTLPALSSRNLGSSWKSEGWKEKLLSSEISHYLTPSMVKGHLRLSYTEEFEEFLGNLLQSSGCNGEFYGSKGPNGKLYFIESFEDFEQKEPIKSPLLFKGSFVMRTVIETPDKVNDKKVYANTSVTKWVIAELTKTISKKLYSYSIDRTLPESEHEDLTSVTITDNMAL